METQTFMQYLEKVFNTQFADMVLDDDLPDAFDSWLAQLDVQEVIDYADIWGEKLKADLTK